MNEADREDKRRSRELSQKGEEEKEKSNEPSRGRASADTRERNEDGQEKDAEQVWSILLVQLLGFSRFSCLHCFGSVGFNHRSVHGSAELL